MGVGSRASSRALQLFLSLVITAGCSGSCDAERDESPMQMPWARLDDPERDRSSQTARIEELLDLREGMSVADVGAGVGYFAFRFAHVVGPDGRVFATDVDESMVERMEASRDARSVENLEILAVEGDELGLTDGSVDRIAMVNSVTFAECEGGGLSYLRACHRALRPGGRLLIVHERVHSTEWSPPYGPSPECDEPTADEILELGRGLFVLHANDALEGDGTVTRGESAGFILALDRI